MAVCENCGCEVQTALQTCEICEERLCAECMGAGDDNVCVACEAALLAARDATEEW